MSPRTKQQNEEIRENSRRRILDAALKLFAERGFNGTSVSDVAREAGVAKGLIYNYFSSKEDLMYNIFQDGFAEGDAVMRQMAQLVTPREKLDFIFEISRQYTKERFEYQKLNTMLALKIDSFPALQELVLARYRDTSPFLLELLAANGVENPEREGRILLAALNGAGIQYLIFRDEALFDQTLDDLKHKYCK